MSRRGSESGINNSVFSAVMASIGLTALALWFFLHPNSPWHSRNTYWVAFEEIGTLVEGNTVQINGVPQGSVVQSVLLDSCVWVGIQVRSQAHIPANSTFKIINAGLMGERAVEILLGDSPSMLASGDSVQGTFDMGSTRLAMMVIGCLREVDGLITTGKDLLDTVLSPENKARYTRIGRKGERLIGNVRDDSQAWMDSLQVLSSNLSELQVSAQTIAAEVKPGIQLTADSLLAVRGRLLALQEPLTEVMQRAERLATQLGQTDNSLGLVLHGTALPRELQSLSAHAEALLGKIQKSGLDLNVDIW